MFVGGHSRIAAGDPGPTRCRLRRPRSRGRLQRRHCGGVQRGAEVGGDELTDAIDREAAVRSMDAANRAGVIRYVMTLSATVQPESTQLISDDDFFTYARRPPRVRTCATPA